MFDNISELAKTALVVIVISLLAGSVFALFLFSSGSLTDRVESLEKDIEFVNKYPPFENIAVMKDGSLAYVDDYEDTYQSKENSHHPAEVVEDISFFDYTVLTIFVVAMILVAGKALINILYIVFPFVFKIPKIEEEEDKKEPIDDDSRYEWINEFYRDIE